MPNSDTISGSELLNMLNIYPRRILSTLRAIFVWLKRERKFKKFLDRVRDISDHENKSGVILIVIQPWLLTPLPWYLIAVAFAFHFSGKNVNIIWDDMNTDFSVRNLLCVLQQNSIRRIIKIIPHFIKCMRLSDYSDIEVSLPPSFRIDHLVRKNKIIHYRGEVYSKGEEDFANTVEKKIKNTARHIQSFLNNNRPSYIIVGGGGYGASGIWLELARPMNIRVATIDAGFSILLISTDGIAANLEDIERAFKLLPEEDSPWIIAEAQQELQKRVHGEDQFTSQIAQPGGDVGKFGVLLPLNQSYDLSALERHNVFGSQTEWLLETIDWVLKNSSENVVVRRHPIERFPQFRSNDDYQKSIMERFGKNDRIFFVDSGADINTYDLIEKAKVVVPYVSTVGIEAAALGKIVVTEGRSCYANLGFVWYAQNREEYFDYLDRALKGVLKVSEKQREDAWRCYYLSQCCNFYQTVFTPMPTDFDKWVLEKPEELLSKQEVLDIVAAIDNNIPLSILVHNKKKLQRVERNATPLLG